MHLNLLKIQSNSVQKYDVIKILLHTIAWTFFFILPSFLKPADGSFKEIPLVLLVLPWIILMAFYYSNYYLFIPKILLKKSLGLYLLIILAIFSVFFCFPEIIELFSNIESKPPNDKILFGRLSGIISFLLTFIISTITCIINELFSVIRIKNKVEMEKVKTEQAFLKSQFNPHFLFNTLYSIYYLSLTKSDKAPSSIMKLSDMMRFILSESQNDYILIQKEINHIAQYIDLQKLRIPAKTQIEFKVQNISSELQIAPLLLMPFVENAFKYGVSSHFNTCIKINLLVEKNSVELKVSNGKYNLVDESEKHNIGIRNVKKRLEIHYPNSYKLTITDKEDSFFIHLKIINI